MKNAKIIISILVVIAIIACAFTACKGGKKTKDGASATVVVTDENGEAVTNENGEFVTVAVDENGETIPDSGNGGEGVNINDSDDNGGVTIGSNGGAVNINSNGKKSKSNNNKTTAAKATTKGGKTPVTKPAAPAKPTGFKASNVEKDSLTLSWKAVKCSGYEVGFKGPDGRWQVLKDAMTATSFPISGLKPYTTYTFRLRAFNQNAAGKSTSAWVTTSAKTKEDKKYERNITVKVKLPVDSNKEDTLQIYIDEDGKGKEVLIKTAKIKCNGKDYTFKTEKKYQGVVTIKGVLVNHKSGYKVKTNGDSCELDLTGIGIDSEVDEKEI